MAEADQSERTDAGTAVGYYNNPHADQPFAPIDGHRSASAELPADVVIMIDNVRIADSLLQLRRDKILLLRAAIHQLSDELRLRLTDLPELSS